MPFAPVRYTRLVPVASVSGAPDAAGLSWPGAERDPARAAVAVIRTNAATTIIVVPSAVARERLSMNGPPRLLMDVGWYVGRRSGGFRRGGSGVTNGGSRWGNWDAHATIVASM